MPLLNTADALYLGSTAIDKVYLGSNLVWEPAGGVEYGPPQSIYPVSVSPSSVSESPDYALASQILFLSDGRITGIRYWRVAGQLTSRYVALWADNGTLLFGTTTSGDVDGWNVEPVSPPVLVANGDAIRVAIDYYGSGAGDGAYPVTENLTIPVDTADMDWISGVYSATPGTFPTIFPTIFNNHYFVDLVYEPEVGGETAPGFVVPVFRAKDNTGYQTGSSSCTVNKPAGTVENDILIASLFRGRGSTDWGVLTPPSGFTLIGTTDVVAGGFNGRFQVYWKRAGGSEPSSYTWDHASHTSNDQLYIAAYSGCPTSGDPIDVFSQNTSNGSATATGLSVITSQANDKLIWLGHNWDASASLAPPGGMTERYDHLTYSADITVIGTGATGNKSQAQATASNPWAVFMIALKGVAAPVSEGPTAPNDWLLDTFVPGAGRNDFTGEVGVRYGIAGADITVTWLGTFCGITGGTRTVKICEWFTDVPLRTVTVDMTGKTAGTWVWTPIAPLTLLANGYYSVLQEVTATDGLQWSNADVNAIAIAGSEILNLYSCYRIPGGGPNANTVNAMYVGLDLGWNT